ncbi:hypothetical protein JZ751_010992 [Albula glossodonta]|uniref:Signal-induced proliferation-associated 1-like protein C-terminal domain-containing protein n=1 Tax=Albula glossodonta TaxID=121402 RepID=A0A8T2NTN4_9TELE|nr:hypothetical protein JZ751_010992 [Albula glossodonta]
MKLTAVTLVPMATTTKGLCCCSCGSQEELPPGQFIRVPSPGGVSSVRLYAAEASCRLQAAGRGGQLHDSLTKEEYLKMMLPDSPPGEESRRLIGVAGSLSPRRSLYRTLSDESVCSNRKGSSYGSSHSSALDQAAPNDILFSTTPPYRSTLPPRMALGQGATNLRNEFWFSDGSLADRSKSIDPSLMPLPDTASGLDWSHLVDAARAFEAELLVCEIYRWDGTMAYRRSAALSLSPGRTGGGLCACSSPNSPPVAVPLCTLSSCWYAPSDSAIGLCVLAEASSYERGEGRVGGGGAGAEFYRRVGRRTVDNQRVASFCTLTDVQRAEALQISQELRRRAAGAEGPALEAGESSPTTLTGKVNQLEVILKQLQYDLRKEKEDKAVLQVEVQHLRQDNMRLQEESQTATAQLRKFTDWFFHTIDKKP